MAKSTKTKVKEVASMIDEMKELIETISKDAAKFDGGNNAAGTRARKGLQELKVLIKAAREEVTAIKDQRKEGK